MARGFERPRKREPGTEQPRIRSAGPRSPHAGPPSPWRALDALRSALSGLRQELFAILTLGHQHRTAQGQVAKMVPHIDGLGRKIVPA